MYCPFCEHSDTRVIDSREAIDGVRRRRECRLCGQRFNTMEQPQRASILVVKHDGRRELFNRDKVRSGTLIACTKRPVSVEEIESLVATVERDLESTGRVEIPSDLIGQLIMEKLRALDRVAYVRFASVYRNFQDIANFAEEIESLRYLGHEQRDNQMNLDEQIPLPIQTGDREGKQRKVGNLLPRGARRSSERPR